MHERSNLAKHNISSEMCHYLRNYFRHEAAGKKQSKAVQLFFFLFAPVSSKLTYLQLSELGLKFS